MSSQSSEKNYINAKALYQKITNDFYEIENNSDKSDDNFMITQTLLDIKKINLTIKKIHLNELKIRYNEETVKVLDQNIKTYNEASYFIERALSSMILFDDIRKVLSQYMKNVDWSLIENTEKAATLKLGRFLTNEKNFKRYRTIISNIIKGTLSKQGFANMYKNVSVRLKKVKAKTVNQRNPLPPAAWPKKVKAKWDKEQAKRKADIMKQVPEDETGAIEWNESFVSFQSYLKNKNNHDI